MVVEGAEGTSLNRAVAPSYGSVGSADDSEMESIIVDSSIPPKKVSRGWYLAYYIPALEWMRNYSWEAFPGDLCSGLTLASFQIPVSLSYATSLANLEAISGLYGLIIAPLVYSILGSVPVMVVSPEGPISLIIGKLSPPYFVDPDHRHGRSDLDAEQISALISGMAGAIVLFLGLLRTGFLTSVLAQSLLRGFITGVGVVMIADQLPAMLGLSKKMHKVLGLEASSFAKVKFTWHNWRSADPVEAKFALYALAALLAFKLLKKYLINKKGYKRAVLIPDILLVVCVSTIISKVGDFARKGLSVVGDVNADGLELLWMLRPKYTADFKINFQSSFFICILGLLESTVAIRLLGTSIVGPAGSDDQALRSSNRELVALGAANVLGSLFGSLPSFGGYGRSKINMLSGGTTQMSAIVSALVTLLCTHKLMSIVYHLPRCVLSAIIASIGISLLEEAPHEVKFFYRMRSYGDLTTMIVAFLTTFFWSVEAGVTVGVGTALLRIVRHATVPRIQILSQDPQTRHFVNANSAGFEDIVRDSPTLVVKIPEPLTFANSTVLEDRLKRLEMHGTTKVHPGQPSSRNQHLEAVIFHLKGMTGCDASGAVNLLSLIEGYLSRGIRVILTEVVPEVQDTLELSGINDLLTRQPYEAYYSTVHDAFHSLHR